MKRTYINKRKRAAIALSYDRLLRCGDLKGKKELQVEIQIRTLAMNFWATIEHSLQYKYKQNMPENIRERLSSAAEAILILDREMSVVRDEIMDAQNSFRIKANIVADILTNIQNLYKVANKQEVVSIQDEFFRIYQNGDQDELTRFSKELDQISARYHAQSLR
jgi:putative GTP pyrophosphokinase